MRSALHADVRWLPGATAGEALQSLRRAGRQSICHAHMTLAETVAILSSPVHRAPVVSTRHFAARRGSSRLGRVAAPWIARRLARQIAVSEYVATRLERRPDAVVLNGVPPSPLLWTPEHRVVLVLQRLEPEKDTITALEAWRASRLVASGWSLRVVGDGSERRSLQDWASSSGVEGVVFAGWTNDVASELGQAGVVLATTPSEALGLGVIEAMAAGVPVIACGSGGHLESVGRLPEAPLFPAGDAPAAAEALRTLLSDERRAALSVAGRQLVEEQFTSSQQVDRLLAEYGAVLEARGHPVPSAAGCVADDR
jgi:glycosyltransferase involved in cell wall biosynthesis